MKKEREKSKEKLSKKFPKEGKSLRKLLKSLKAK